MKPKLKGTTTAFITITSIVFILFALFAINPSGSNAKHGGQVDAAAVYSKNCTRCHGADGRAQTAKGKQTNATDFTSSKWQISDAKGIKIIANGHELMPAYKDTLSAEEIKAVMVYIRRFKK